MSEDVNLNAYFERIGFAGSIAPTLATLEALHVLQPASIPFENFNSLVGIPVPLDQASLNRKLLSERRGGYCFELNLMFLRILVDLGFEARAHLASVLRDSEDQGTSPPSHMLITVDISGTTYLADVGFGGLLQTVPLKLRTGVEQETPLGTYRLTGEDPALRLELKRHEEDWRPVYRFALDAVDEATYVQVNDELNADPEWFFHHHLLVERAAPSGRLMMFDTRLTNIAPDGTRETKTLPTVGEMRETLATMFNMDLPTFEGLDTALGKILTRSTVGG